jgi:hypothetical protein
VCKKPLSKREYQQALGILSERDKHHEHELSEYERKLREAQTRERKAKEEGIKFERSRTQRLLAGKDRQILTLKDRIDQLKKGSTPQTEGLEFEEKLTVRLRREFPDDDIQHKGKAGDVLHFVKYEKKIAGIIIYECKRGPKIKSDHVQQAYQAKQTREADFGVLVTTGEKKGFSGLAQMGGVLVVSPLGAVPLAALLRAHLIEMLRAKISKQKRAIVAQNLMKYITSPQFKNPIEEVIELSTELQDMLKDEYNDHIRVWKKRMAHYRTIEWDTSRVHENLQLVLHGKEPKQLARPKEAPLQLPASTK